MTMLRKNFTVKVTAGMAGSQGSPGVPAIIPRYVTGTRTVRKPNPFVYRTYGVPGMMLSGGILMVANQDWSSTTGYTRGAEKYVLTEETYCYWTDYTPRVPPTPAYPPTPPQITKIANKGWNVSARSGDPLTPNSYIEFTVGDGSQGVFVGIGPLKKDNLPTNYFSHSAIVDSDGVKIFEGGVNVKTLTSTQTAANKIRIYLHEDRNIIYVVISGTNTYVYTSESKFQRGDAYAYANMYSSGDSITSSEFVSGIVSYGRV